jgi:hypothetical protein
LSLSLEAKAGSHQYFTLPTGEVLIIYSKERLEVLFERSQKLKAKK